MVGAGHATYHDVYWENGMEWKRRERERADGDEESGGNERMR